MRILVLNQYFHPDASATSQLLTQLVEDLSENHDITVVSGRPSYNRQRTDVILRSNGLSSVVVKRVRSTAFSRRSMLGRVANYLTFLAGSMLPALASPKPDVVMAWTDPPPVAAIAALVARLRRAPFVFVCQDIAPESVIAAGELRNPVMIAILRATARAGLKGASRVVSIGRDMNERLLGLGVEAERIVTITNWSDGELVKPLSGPNPFRSRNGWDDKFVVMHSGNLGMGQDLDTLVDAAELLREEPGLVIAIVGDGMHKAALQRRVADSGISNMEFLPFQPASELALSLGAADVHLVTHRRGMEGFGVPSKLYGILAAGRPCIAAVVPGCEVALTIEEAGNGTIVDPGDPTLLADAIRAMRDAPLVALGQSARIAFEQRHNRNISTDRYRSLLEEVAAAGRAGSKR